MCGRALVVVAVALVLRPAPVVQAVRQPARRHAPPPVLAGAVVDAGRAARPRAPVHVLGAAPLAAEVVVLPRVWATVVGQVLDKGVANDFVENHSGSCGGARGVH